MANGGALMGCARILVFIVTLIVIVRCLGG